MEIRTSRLRELLTRLGLVVVLLVLALVAVSTTGSANTCLSDNTEDVSVQVYGGDDADFEHPVEVTVNYDNGPSYDQTRVYQENTVASPPPETGGDFIPGIPGSGNIMSVTIRMSDGTVIIVDRNSVMVCHPLWWRSWICYCVRFTFYKGSTYIRVGIQPCP